MVEIRNLSAGYGREDVLQNLSVSFPKGSITAVLGPNGCGKSTLLKSIIGLVPKVRGELLADGVSLSTLDTRQIARKIAYLPQTGRTPDMTVGQLVLHGRFPYLNYPRRYRDADRQAAQAAMETLGLQALADTPLTQLSGGTLQKSRIAMALAQDAPVILMDEPLSFLDISHQLQLLELVRTLAQRGKTFVLVLHDLSLALRFADRILLMEQGRIFQTGTPEEILNSGALEQVFAVKVHTTQTPAGKQVFFTNH